MMWQIDRTPPLSTGQSPWSLYILLHTLLMLHEGTLVPVMGCTVPPTQIPVLSPDPQDLRTGCI